MKHLLLSTISPGNRVETGRRECPTASVGIDTIRVGGRLAKRPDLSLFGTTAEHAYGSHGERFPSAGWSNIDGVKVIAHTNYYGLGPYASWEISLPNLIDGHNLRPTTLSQAMDMLRHTYECAGAFVRWAIPFESLAIKRLDSDRDFHGIDDIPGVLAALGHLAVPPLSQHYIWSTTKGVHAIGSTKAGRWKAQLYDKQAQLVHLRSRAALEDRPPIAAAINQADGIIRFECRTWTPVNKEKGIATIGDLTDDLLNAVNRSYFDKCQFGRAVEGWSKVHRLMADSLEESASTKDIAGMLTHLLYLSEGLSSPYRSRTTIQKYRRMADEFEFSQVDFRVSKSKAMYLDFDSGELLVDGADPKLAWAA
jgi:hypothetical protein